MQIRGLFDSSRDIYRTIEKVITYGASQEARLRAEIGEYVVTESIEDHMEQLLSKMQFAMEAGGENEVGVWVSGFYGSGKSSLTKYMGLALDDSVTIDGVPFLKHLQDRCHRPQTKALLATVATRFPATVVFLDLASEMLAGATMEDVSSVLYYKVLQHAGYSRNLKVAAFERKLQADGRYDEFVAEIESAAGTSWSDVQNDTLVIDSLVPDLAHSMYPEIFRSATTFSTDASEFVRFENERVADMLDIIRAATGKEHVIFIVDEVGQYIGSRPNLILNLDGLAKNLKALGDGKVWIIGTAQQTLTEDDERAALNSPQLFKLKDRFPIQLDLESSDIKEICYRRLLCKSPEGDRLLGELFDSHGQALRHSTKLHDAPVYGADLDRETFTNLYPFLPVHFDLLLFLLGKLAPSTGGIGLRSAIKVIQDILVEGPDDQQPVAEQEVGWLATTETLYDALEKDIRRAFPEKHAAISNVFQQFPGCDIHAAVAKTVVVLQILNNMPVNAQNVASLLHLNATAPSRRDDVEAAIADLMNHQFVPFGEKDGNLCFFSETLNEIDHERGQIPLRSIETRRIFNESIKEALSPLPRVQLHGSLTVASGLKVMAGSMVSSLAGDRDTVQTIVRFALSEDYEAIRAELVEDSRQRSAASTIYLVARDDPGLQDQVAEIYRCQEIAQRHRNDPEQEVKEYCTGQADRAHLLLSELHRSIKKALAAGSFVFRAKVTAVSSLATDLLDANKKHLADVADQVFDRYGEAPTRVDTGLAEKFMRAENLRAITSAIDPLGLVKVSGGTPSIDTDHKAMLSIRDYIDKTGTAEGKRLLDHFGDAPFGWSQDTVRYLVAAMLLAGEIKLRVSGQEVTVNGQKAIDALRNNNSFKKIGVALRDDRPDTDVLARAAMRLTELTGNPVLPLEDEISKTAAKSFSRFQHQFGPLAEKLERLSLSGASDARDLRDELADLLLADASDAPSRLGAEDSSLYKTLDWALAVDKALESGLETTLSQLQEHRRTISGLPDSGIPGALKGDLAEDLTLLDQRLQSRDFHKHAADFSTTLTDLKARVRDCVQQLGEAQKQSIRDAQDELTRLPEWSELNQDEKSQTLARLDELAADTTDDLDGLTSLVNQEFAIQSRQSELRSEIQRIGQDRQRKRLEEEREKAKKEGRKTLTRTIHVPSSLSDPSQLEALIQQLQALRSELSLYSDIEVTVQVED
jgi:hypothetical protein